MRSALLVAATGGHLEQLVRIGQAVEHHVDEVVYATFRNEQSTSLLRGQDVRFVRTVPPRGLVPALRVLPDAVSTLRGGRFTDIISTGSGVAVPFFLAGRALGLRCHYVESAARTRGPSLTGHLLSRVPGVRLSTQHSAWADGRWTHAGSVFDGYSCVPATDTPVRPSRVVVTLGTVKGVPFNRAVRAAERMLQKLAVPEESVLWQVGDADTSRNNSYGWIPSSQLRAAITDADLVFSHAGVGSCLQVLESGKVPILLPRLGSHGEAVDDHQLLLSQHLSDRGLAVVTDPDRLEVDHVREAMSKRVVHDRPEVVRLLEVLDLTDSNLDPPTDVFEWGLADRIGKSGKRA